MLYSKVRRRSSRALSTLQIQTLNTATRKINTKMAKTVIWWLFSLVADFDRVLCDQAITKRTCYVARLYVLARIASLPLSECIFHWSVAHISKSFIFLATVALTIMRTDKALCMLLMMHTASKSLRSFFICWVEFNEDATAAALWCNT